MREGSGGIVVAGLEGAGVGIGRVGGVEVKVGRAP